MFIALQLIGTPSEAELEFLNENAKRYIRNLPPHPRQRFTEKFPQVHPLAIDLIEKMLTFDPRKRITGEELLFYVAYFGVRDFARLFILLTKLTTRECKS